MAEFLNDWAFRFAERTPGCLRSATFYPEPGAAAYVAKRIGSGAEIFKVHVQVGGFDVRDPLLDDVWGVLEDARVPVVVTPFFDQLGAAFPADLVPRLRDLQPKVLLGSDFPNIPYRYAEQLSGLARLDLDDDWLRDVCWGNGVRLFGESESSSQG